jgi:hypothetical protein
MMVLRTAWSDHAAGRETGEHANPEVTAVHRVDIP